LRRREKWTFHPAAGWLALLGAAAAASAHGQAPAGEALYVDLAECVALNSEAARYACYQERVDAALAERDSPATAGSPAAGARAPVAERTASPTSAPATAERPSAPAARATREFEIDEIFGTITALRERGPDIWVITLDNGQVWQMNQPKRYPLRVGLEVRLNSTRWGGSYRLTAPEHGGFVQVKPAF
jgi:hypothetical protein